MSAPSLTKYPAPLPPAERSMRPRVPSRPVLPPVDMPIREPRNHRWPSLPPVVDTKQRPRRASTIRRFHRDLRALGDHVRASLIADAAYNDGPAAFLLRVAWVQALLAAGAALLASVLAMDGRVWALWLLILVVLADGGAGAAYALLHVRGATSIAGMSLLCSQLVMLVWAFELDGPRMALFAFVPALALFAMRVAGRTFAITTTGAVLTLALAWRALHVRSLFLATLHWGRADAVTFDALMLAGGLLLLVFAILDMQERREAVLRLAESRVRQDGDLRVSHALLLAELAADAERLAQVLAGEQRSQANGRLRHSRDPLSTASVLQRLEELIDFSAERMETLQRDREDRVRLEGAIMRLLRAVELIELGRRPRWPEPTGTAVDSVVARLRELYPDAAPYAAHGVIRLAAGYPFSSHGAARPSPVASAPTGVILPWRHERG